MNAANPSFTEKKTGLSAGLPGVSIGQKIIVLGCPGSGKSRFSARLHELTSLPLTHLDNVWWRPDGTHISREEFDERLCALMRAGRWILDGDYSRTYEPRIRACDTVVFLDFAEAECMDGIAARVGKARADIPWIENALDPALVRVVRNYRTENRPIVYALLEKYPEKQRLIFRDRKQADAWLSALGESRGETPPA